MYEGDGETAGREPITTVAEQYSVLEDRVAELEAENAELKEASARYRGWPGLMNHLDDYWPASIFPTLPDGEDRDEGPRIVSLIRVVDGLKADNEALRLGLQKADEHRAETFARYEELLRWERWKAEELRALTMRAEPFVAYLTGTLCSCAQNPESVALCFTCRARAVLKELRKMEESE